MSFQPIPETPSAGHLQGEAVTVGTRSASEQRPELEVTPPFLLMAHPHRWMVIEGGNGPELLPELATLPVEPGVGNVNEHGDPSLAMAKRSRGDWIIIPEAMARATDTPDGRPGYVRRFSGRRGFMHVTAWDKIKVVAGRLVRGSDQERYHAWLRRLVNDGVIPAPDPDVIEAMLDRARTRADRAGSRDLSSDLAARLKRQADERVEALAELALGASDEVELHPEYDDIQGPTPEPTPEPVHKRQRAKKGTSHG